MDLADPIVMANTRAKLRMLEERYEASRRQPDPNPRVHEQSQRSLKRLINQLKEELVRGEIAAKAQQAVE
jgi:hypothetical protein